jgi:hypothetical protein
VTVRPEITLVVFHSVLKQTSIDFLNFYAPLATETKIPLFFIKVRAEFDRLCGLVVRVLGYRSGGLGSIPDTNRKKVVGLERGPLSPVSTIEELHDRKVAAPVYKIENTAVGILHADHVAPSIRKS